MANSRRFAVREHQDKAVPFVQALIDCGYTLVPDFRDADFYLIDVDRRIDDLKECLSRQIPVFIYPHGSRTVIAYDGVYSAWPHTACNFVFGSGQVEIGRRIKYPCPMEPVGWAYNRLRPFSPTSGKRILFAPIHPNGGGIPLSKIDRELNRRAFDTLRELAVPFTVRYGRNLSDNNIPEIRDPLISYSQAELSVGDSLRAIEKFDLIIGHQLFASLAISLGKPTVMFGESAPPHSVRRSVRSWSLYQGLLQFPLDLIETCDPRSLLESACRSDLRIADWRSKFIGCEFDPIRFVDQLQSYLLSAF